MLEAFLASLELIAGQSPLGGLFLTVIAGIVLQATILVFVFIIAWRLRGKIEKVESRFRSIEDKFEEHIERDSAEHADLGNRLDSLADNVDGNAKHVEQRLDRIIELFASSNR